MSDQELVALARRYGEGDDKAGRQLIDEVPALIERHRAEVERLTRENQLHPDDMVIARATWAWMKQRAEAAESALAAAAAVRGNEKDPAG